MLLCVFLLQYRWRLVTHSGIDGYSRMIVYMQCSDNNRADTKLQCFRRAVNSHGLSSRVRSDCGGENVALADYMLIHPERIHILNDCGTTFFSGVLSCSII